MALQVVTHANFGATVGASTGVYVLLLHDFYPPLGSPEIGQEALMEAVMLHYAEYTITGVAFGHSDIIVRDILGDVPNVRTRPSYIFYFNHVEYYRTSAYLTDEQIKYIIEQKRTGV
ncbi:MAG: hypothetical protein WC712_13630 [Candidatus Brocadiia bacterium]